MDITGAVQRTLYDAAGRVIGTRVYAARISPDATLWGKLYAGTALPADIAVVANNTLDQLSWQVLDQAGLARYTIDALGNVQERYYDAANRLVGTRGYACLLYTSRCV